MNLFEKVLSQQHYSGYEGHDGNGMVGGRWCGGYIEKTIEDLEVEVEEGSGTYYVYFDVDAIYEYSDDESTNWSDSSIIIEDVRLLEITDAESLSDAEKDEIVKKAEDMLREKPEDYINESVFYNDGDYYD